MEILIPTSASDKTVKQPSLAELGEKIDKILVYQKRATRIAIFRGVISFIFFLIFIVLPIIGGFYLFQYLKENVDFKKISDQYQEIYETIGELKETKSQISDLKDSVSAENIKKPLNSSN